MALVGALGLLLRAWILTAAVGVVAVLDGVSIVYHIAPPSTFTSRQHELGIASVAALIDTPTSQVVDLGGPDSTHAGMLAGRASLLASLMTSSPIKDEIAKRAGVDPRELIAIPPPSAGTAVPPAPGLTGASVSESDPRAHVIRASVPTLQSGDMPLVQVETQAPDAEA